MKLPFLASWFCLWLSSAVATPVVHRNGVTYIGTITSDTESFLNIRYGQDTGNENRFKRPFPYSYPTGAIVNATQPGAACPQQLGNPVPSLTGLFGKTTQISEDCLTVRVDRPRNTHPGARLPVMVYLYGGGYAVGQIYDDTAYNPAGLVRENAKKGLPVIYIAINYRVGFFGFAASSALRDEDNLNAGLLDQRLGLQWVHDHIAAFGGDPDNVTIFGENVGWTNAQLQLTAYGGVQAPLFHRAILQSGPTLSGDALTAGLSDNHTTALAQLLNCTSAPDDSSAELKCLRSVPLGTLVGAAVDFSLAFSPLAGIGTWRPTAPSSFVPDAPSKLLQAGRFHRHVDILVGWNEDDGTQFVLPTLSGTPGFAAFIQYLFPGLSPANNQQLLALYPESDFSDMPSEHIDRNFFRAAQVVRDAHFACPSLRVVEAWKQHAPARKTYLYSLNQTVFRVGHAEYNKSYVGQDHFSDIPYVFDYVDVPPYSTVADQTDYDMASQMSGSWAAFANFGQPTVPGLSAQQLAARNLTFAPWDPAFGRCGNLDTVALRVLGGPRDGMASIPWSGKADRAATVYDEKLAERCGFWDREDVLAQTWM